MRYFIMKFKGFATAGAVAALLLSGAAAMAAMTPRQSDENINYVRGYVARATEALQHDAGDYGGHREAAISDLTQATRDLTSALQWDLGHERGFTTMPPIPDLPTIV